MPNLLAKLLLFCLLVGHSLADDCGSLEKLEPGKDCVIIRTSPDPTKPCLLKIVDLQFTPKDSLKVNISEQLVDVNCSGNCLLVLPPQKEYQFKVTTSKEILGTRKINKIEAIKAKGAQIFLFDRFSVNILPNANFQQLELTNDDNENTAVLLSTENSGVTAEALENGVVVSGTQTDLAVSDFLTDKKKFTLTFKVDKSNETTIFDFEQRLVTRNCSSTKTLDDKIDSVQLTTVDKDNVLSRVTHTCAYLVKAPTGNLEVGALDLKAKSDYDSVQIKDGLKLTAKDLISSNSKTAAAHLTDFDSRVSSTNGVLVILTSNFVSSSPYEQGSVTIKKSAFNVFSEPKDKISISTDSVYVFKFNETAGYPYLNFASNFALTADRLTIHDRVFGEPIFAYTKGELVFSEVWSETRVLVLNFTGAAGAKPDTQTANLSSKKISCSRMVTSPSSLVLKGSVDMADQTCHLYIKPESNIYPVALHLQNLRLTNGACLRLWSPVDAKGKELFNLCASDKNPDIVREHFPDFVLSSKSYILSYVNSKTYKDTIMLQAAFSYHAVDLIRNVTLTKESPSVNISSFDYPSNYPYYLIDRMSGIDQVISDTTRYLAVSFERYNLRNGDNLAVIGKQLKWTGNRPDDFVHIAELKDNQTSLMLSLTTKFDGLNSLLADEHATGFKVEFERFECVLELKDGILKTPDYPKPFENATKCIAIIDQSEDKKYLNLTVENGKENIDFGELTVFDDASRLRRNPFKVFDQKLLKDNQTFSFNTSSTKIVILFDPLGKKPVNGFQITITKEKCEFASCDKNTRCLLPSIHCNYVADCLDGTDEQNCVPDPDNKPTPPPPERVIYRGLSGWWITLVIIPLSCLVGAFLHLKWPVIQARFRGSHSYREFSSFNSENA